MWEAIKTSQIRNPMHEVLCKHEFEIDTHYKIRRNKQLVG